MSSKKADDHFVERVTQVQTKAYEEGFKAGIKYEFGRWEKHVLAEAAQCNDPMKADLLRSIVGQMKEVAK